MPAKPKKPLQGKALVKEVCRRIRLAKTFWKQHRNAPCRGERESPSTLRNAHTRAERTDSTRPQSLATLPKRKIRRPPKHSPIHKKKRLTCETSQCDLVVAEQNGQKGRCLIFATIRLKSSFAPSLSPDCIWKTQRIAPHIQPLGEPAIATEPHQPHVPRNRYLPSRGP